MVPSRGLRTDSLQSGLVFTLIGRVAGILGGGAVTIILARNFGTALYGQWNTAVVYGALVAICVEGGLNGVLLRDASRDRDAAGEALGMAIKGRFGLGTIVVPLALTIAWFLTPTKAAWLLIVLLVLARYFEVIQTGFQSTLYALGNYRTPSAVETTRRALLPLAVGAVVLAEWDIRWAAAATLVLVLGANGAFVVICRRAMRIRFDRSLAEYWRDARWFWLSGVLFWVNGEIDQLMLSRMKGDEAVGIYAAGYRIAVMFRIIPDVVANNLFPRLFRSAKDGQGLERQLYGATMLLTGLAVVVFTEIQLVGGEVITLLYGDAYAASVAVFLLYGIYLLMDFTRGTSSWFITASDRVSLITFYRFLTAATNVVANLILIPKYGILGAAYATIASEVVMTMLSLSTVLVVLGPRILGAIVLGGLIGSPAVAVHFIAQPLPWWVATRVGDGPRRAGVRRAQDDERLGRVRADGLTFT